MQMDNGLDTYESDKEPEEAAEQGNLEEAGKSSMPSGSLEPPVDASDPASSTDAMTHAPSTAGVSHADLASSNFQHTPVHLTASAIPAQAHAFTQQQNAELTWRVSASLSQAMR